MKTRKDHLKLEISFEEGKTDEEWKFYEDDTNAIKKV